MELEDEDGKAIPITATELAEIIRVSGHSAPLVFLASCHSGGLDPESTGFAQGLLNGGVRLVLAMQTLVSDVYATELAGYFYEELSRAETPMASRALALARQKIEKQRQGSALTFPEFATPSLFVLGEENVILDRALPQRVMDEVPPVVSSGGIPLLKMGDLIGRRREARRLVRVLTDDPNTSNELGLKVGCQILGTGGVGKSELAGRVMRRMSDRGWIIATVSGAWNLGDLALAVGSTLCQHSAKGLIAKGMRLSDQQVSDDFRLHQLQNILTHERLLLVLDNFEDLLLPGGAKFKDSVTEKVFHTLMRSAQTGKILITSRHPVPGSNAYIHRMDLGPLSQAETKKLILRHSALAKQSAENITVIERAIGGHPRTLEYLDALLRDGQARLSRVQENLELHARTLGISLHGSNELEARVRDAIRVSAADTLVAELVRILRDTPEHLKALLQASVIPVPFKREALTFDYSSPDHHVDSANLSDIVKHLIGISLLSVVDNETFIVHRWTAETLKASMEADVYEACCSNAAEYLATLRAPDLRQAAAERVACVRLFWPQSSLIERLR